MLLCSLKSGVGGRKLDLVIKNRPSNIPFVVVGTPWYLPSSDPLTKLFGPSRYIYNIELHIIVGSITSLLMVNQGLVWLLREFLCVL